MSLMIVEHEADVSEAGKVGSFILVDSTISVSKSCQLPKSHHGATNTVPNVLIYLTTEFRGLKMSYYTVRCFTKAIKFGSKYVYQTVPRLLTLWLDAGEDRSVASHEAFRKMNEAVAKSIKEVPVYKVRLIATY